LPVLSEGKNFQSFIDHKNPIGLTFPGDETFFRLSRKIEKFFQLRKAAPAAHRGLRFLSELLQSHDLFTLKEGHDVGLPDTKAPADEWGCFSVHMLSAPVDIEGHS